MPRYQIPDFRDLYDTYCQQAIAARTNNADHSGAANNTTSINDWADWTTEAAPSTETLNMVQCDPPETDAYPT